MKSTVAWTFILGVTRAFKGWILAMLIVNLLWAIDLSLRPYLLKVILDKLPILAREEAFQGLSQPVFWYIFFCLLMTLNFRVYDYIWLKVNSPMKRMIGDQLTSRLLQHSQEFFQNHFAGSLGAKIKDVMSGVPDSVRIIVDKFITQLGSLAIATWTVWRVNYRFALGLVAWALIFAMGSILLTRKGRRLSDEAARVRAGVIGCLVDMIGNIMSIRLFTALSYESSRFYNALNQYVEADQRRDWYFLKVFAFQGLSFVVCQAICLWWLMQGYQEGWVSVGDFALILSVNIAIVDQMWSLSKDMSSFAEAVGSITQGLDLILSAVDIKDQPGAKRLQVSKGELVFDRVHFNYKGSELLFENKSLTIAPGQKVGLVGFSGSGKSTFVNLILRLYDPSSGRILIDGQDIRQVTQDSLREHIGMIPQEPSLFHRSLMENIRYGKKEASDEQVMLAAKKARAHDFIVKLADGYQALVGERGVKLSGGQRQRIAIARAIIKDAPFLILDEATSQLDSVTESEIQESLWELMKGKTTLIIAHRLSTLLRMDRLLVFHQGRIIEEGSHQQLLVRENSHYRRLWQAQVAGMMVASNPQELLGD